ncbi:uncharacterized protein [Palaemon carinicauda]|uniref:uncharacterized protein n=1 Tax=Palaemon carinicauda TaxID=392227 RepID=UPI0035B5DDB4
MYLQKDGVAMGSPLGVLFTNFYMGVVEERVFSRICRPDVYMRYIDDTFVMAPSTQDIETFRRLFEECSCRFTVEYSKDGQLPFLDVLISPNTSGFNTKSECPTRVKASTIKAYVHRALSHCSSWAVTHQELHRVAQVLVNNGYSNRQVSREIKLAMDTWYQVEQPTVNTRTTTNLYYKGFMHRDYQKDEKAIRDSIKSHVSPGDKKRGQVDYLLSN